MFERFTDRARRVVVVAQEESRNLGHNYIGTEHILLGLISIGGGVAAKTLESLGVSDQDIRQQVGEKVGRGQLSPTGHIPFTPRAKRVLELSLRESIQLCHNYIGTEHILLALIREGEGVAAQVLTGLGVKLIDTRNEVLRVLEEAGQGPATGRITRAEWRPRAWPGDVEEIKKALALIATRLAAIETKLGIKATQPDAEDNSEPGEAREG
jgi:ATP-dependent Clp protease ATP-binding subunit ClpC